MGWGRTLLLGDIGNRLDIQDAELDIEFIRKRLAENQQLGAHSRLPSNSCRVKRGTQALRSGRREGPATEGYPGGGRVTELSRAGRRVAARFTQQ